MQANAYVYPVGDTGKHMLPTKSVAQENPKAALDKMLNDFVKVGEKLATVRNP
jgi:hypothetical protein